MAAVRHLGFDLGLLGQPTPRRVLVANC